MGTKGESVVPTASAPKPIMPRPIAMNDLVTLLAVSRKVGSCLGGGVSVDCVELGVLLVIEDIISLKLKVF